MLIDGPGRHLSNHRAAGGVVARRAPLKHPQTQCTCSQIPRAKIKVWAQRIGLAGLFTGFVQSTAALLEPMPVVSVQPGRPTELNTNAQIP